MSKPFPDSPFLSDNFAPWLMEGEARDLVVEGEIPRELEGAFYRNSSNPQFAPGPNYHWFEGDGMIHALYFENGRCHYKNRWVRTERFRLEREAGQALFSGMAPGSGDPRTEGVSPNSSNTHVVPHAGRLLSLWEAGPPYEIDPATLDTIGLCDFDGGFRRERFGQLVPDVMTAHPKIDPDTDEWLAFGYSPVPPHLVYHIIGADGKVARSEAIDAPYSAMMHDFIASSEHMIFPVFPAVFDLAKLAETGLALHWEPERGTQVGIMRRDSKESEVLWISHDPCFSFHTVNAQTNGNIITAELWRTPRLVFNPETDGKPFPPHLYRWTIDVEAGTLREEQLDDTAAEFGRIDPRQAGKDYTHLYSLGSLGLEDSRGEPDGFNCIFHYDMKTGARKAHELPRQDSAGEPVFVPRTPDAAEGDGFVITVAHRAEEGRSDVIVLDAQNIESAPLATIRLPHRVPYCFHGSWLPGASIA